MCIVWSFLSVLPNIHSSHGDIFFYQSWFCVLPRMLRESICMATQNAHIIRPFMNTHLSICLNNLLSSYRISTVSLISPIPLQGSHRRIRLSWWQWISATACMTHLSVFRQDSQESPKFAKSLILDDLGADHHCGHVGCECNVKVVIDFAKTQMTMIYELSHIACRCCEDSKRLTSFADISDEQPAIFDKVLRPDRICDNSRYFATSAPLQSYVKFDEHMNS